MFPRPHRESSESRKARNMAGLMVPSKSGGVMGGSTTGPVPKAEKAPPRGEQAHKAKLVLLGCMACRRIFPHLPPGPVELHHLRAGGWGRGDYMTLIPLCVEHHRGNTGVHGLGTKEFPRRYGFDQAEMLMDALELLKGLE